MPENERRPGDSGAHPAAGQGADDDITADRVLTYLAMQGLNASVVESADIAIYALELIMQGYAVGPLCLAGQHPQNPRQRIVVHPFGKDPVPHLLPHGVLDFTTNVGTALRWWSLAPWNVGLRVPAGMMVLDIDPRHGGLTSWATLVDTYGPLAHTLTTLSGRGDGGHHLYVQRPSGKLSAKRLGRGIDLKLDTGYVVAAPSLHPDTLRPYVRVDGPIAAPPRWLERLLLESVPPVKSVTAVRVSPSPESSFWSPVSIADRYSNTTSWADVLGPHGWTCHDADPDADGARWVHPTATSSCSATVRHACLFVYSSNTPFEPTEASNPKGYTRFHAYAVLNHAGDRKAAAAALKAVN